MTSIENESVFVGKKAVEKVKEEPPRFHTLFVDGACPGNPGGPGGAGVVIFDELQNKIYSEGKFVMEKTPNNFAEYSAMVLGLKRCSERGILNLKVRTDSRLMVGQLGFLVDAPVFRVNAPNLKPLHAECLTQIKKFKIIEMCWIPREENKAADRMADAAARTKRDVVIEHREEEEEEEGTKKRVKLDN